MTLPNTEQPADTSLDEIRCIVCNKPIVRGTKGTCMHETGFDHHLQCSFAPETEQAILAWHTTQQKALLKRVREEVIGEDIDAPVISAGSIHNEFKSEQRKALDSLEKEIMG